MQTTDNILLIRLRSMGDVLFTRPAAHALREAFPQSRISFFTSRQNAPLIRGFREIDETLELDYDRFRGGNPKSLLTETADLLRRLRAGRFSLVVDFQGYGETAFLTWWTHAPRRWGNVYGPGRRWAYTRGVRRIDRLHPADWNLSLLEQCGIRRGSVRNDFDLPAEPLAEARRFLAARRLNPARPMLFVQPLTSSPHKNWPLDRYLAVATHWRKTGTQVLFGGGPSERPILEPVRQAGFPMSAGVPLLVAAGLMKLSTVVLGGDTGLLHLAVAMGKRVVMIKTFGGKCHPFQHPDWAVIPPAGRGHPVSTIPTGSVLEACTRAFTEAAAFTRTKQASGTDF